MRSNDRCKNSGEKSDSLRGSGTCYLTDCAVDSRGQGLGATAVLVQVLMGWFHGPHHELSHRHCLGPLVLSPEGWEGSLEDDMGKRVLVTVSPTFPACFCTPFEFRFG